jgi:hypothetical protein
MSFTCGEGPYAAISLGTPGCGSPVGGGTAIWLSLRLVTILDIYTVNTPKSIEKTQRVLATGGGRWRAAGNRRRSRTDPAFCAEALLMMLRIVCRRIGIKPSTMRAWQKGIVNLGSLAAAFANAAKHSASRRSRLPTHAAFTGRISAA